MKLVKSEFMTDIETIRHANGRVRVENGERKGKAGDGRFLKRGTSCRIRSGRCRQKQLRYAGDDAAFDSLRSDSRFQEFAAESRSSAVRGSVERPS